MFAAVDLKETLDKILEGILDTLAERTFYFLVIVGCIIFLIIILIIYSKLKPIIARKREIEKLFKKLSVSNNLNRSEQAILRDVAKFYNIENLNILFLRVFLIKSYVDKLKGDENSQSLISKLKS